MRREKEVDKFYLVTCPLSPYFALLHIEKNLTYKNKPILHIHSFTYTPTVATRRSPFYILIFGKIVFDIYYQKDFIFHLLPFYYMAIFNSQP